MLNILLNKIQTILPVKAIVLINNSINLEYYEDILPSESQLSEINSIINSWPLEKAKIEKIQLLNNSWNQKVKTGWQTPYEYNLGMDISDVALLNGAFALAKEANNLGINDPINIVDTSGQPHPMNLQDLTILMLQYGQARASLSNTYANIQQNINLVTTIEELESIDITL